MKAIPSHSPGVRVEVHIGIILEVGERKIDKLFPIILAIKGPLDLLVKLALGKEIGLASLEGEPLFISNEGLDSFGKTAVQPKGTTHPS